MITCPQCKKTVAVPIQRCGSCQTDLTLLSGFVHGLAGTVDKAEALLRAGELAAAVREYLAILEVDPENAVARKRVAELAAIVRHFDRPPRKRQRRWKRKSPAISAPIAQESPPGPPPISKSRFPAMAIVLVGLASLVMGLAIGVFLGLMW
jgi:hypothetical protein